MLRAEHEGKSPTTSSRANGRFAYANRPLFSRRSSALPDEALRRKMRATHLGPSEGNCAPDVPYRAWLDWKLGAVAMAAEAGIALKGGDADEGSISDEHIAICIGCMYAASATDGLASRSVGSDHGGGFSRHYHICVRRNLPGIIHPGRQRRWPRAPGCGPIHGMPAIYCASNHDDH
jgi:hypothetical protein